MKRERKQVYVVICCVTLWSCRLTWVQESCHVKGLSSWSASHHVSLCSSRSNSSQEPEENKVAPLRPIALRRSSQWQNHQKLRQNISTQGTVRSESQCTRKYSESVPQKSVKCSLYTWAFSLLTVTPLDTWLTSSCTRVAIWSLLLLSVTSSLQSIRLSYPYKE